MTTSSATAAPSLGRSLLGGLAAGGVAALINALLYLTGAIDQDVVVAQGQPVLLAAVITLSVVPNIIGGLVLWGVRRAGRSVRLFQVIVAVVTVLSFVQPLGVGAPTTMVVVLELMHVVAGLAAALVTPRVAGEA